MQAKRKLAALLLSLCMVLGMLPMTVFAAGETTAEGLVYEVNGVSQTIEQRRREMEPATHTSRMCSGSFYIWRITDIRNPCGCWLTTRSPYPMR